MTSVIQLPLTDWNPQCAAELQQQAMQALEEGNVLFFPQLPFTLSENEKKFLTPATVGKSKNVSFDINTDRLHGSSVGEADAPALHGMMKRFATNSHDLVFSLLPHYTSGLVQARTSFRPVEISGRASSWRKDDTRLHVDAFPSAPVQGKRILRVFSNVNVDGKPRSWRLGEPFEQIASRFMPSISDPVWGSSQLLRLCGITKSRRSAYDHFMLQLHDRMKEDTEYQAKSQQSTFDFPPGTTWITYTDVVSHAVMAGQHMMEQSFYLPVASMLDPSRAPLKILERMKERELA